jgi:hypothetical protein
MSSHHEVTLKPISDVANFLKKLLPSSIPETYDLKPIFENIANDQDIRNGVIAFRDFLLVYFERLATNGHLYAKPPKKPTNMADYPFLYNMTNLLVDIGYYGMLTDGGSSLIVSEIPTCTASVDANGKKKSAKISVSAMMECLRFLSLCGFMFTGIDMNAKKHNISETTPLKVSYPGKPNLLIGLKVLAIADMDLRTQRRYWNDNNLLRCDYRLLKAEESDMRDVLTDFLHPLPEKIQALALKLHQRYTDAALTCINTRLGNISFAYVPTGLKSASERDLYAKRVWEFCLSIRDGYSIFVRAKKTEKYPDIIKTFPALLQEKIAQGYGCDRKRGERCQLGCQGIRIPLDESILDIAKEIETWLDNETPKGRK